MVVHELAHQWVGDDLAVAAWQHIWLNEGFASYTEWLWSEREGSDTADDIFGFLASIPADDPFWSLTIGDPGPAALFDGPVYFRGAGTLHALRLLVGDRDFFRILRTWTTQNAGGNVTTSEFIDLAERISGREPRVLLRRLAVHPGQTPGPRRCGPTRARRRGWAAPAVVSVDRHALTRLPCTPPPTTKAHARHATHAPSDSQNGDSPGRRSSPGRAARRLVWSSSSSPHR